MKKHKISEMMLRIRTVYCTEIRKICFCNSYINTYPPSFQATFYNYLYNFLYVLIREWFENASAFLLRDAQEAISDGGLTPTTDTDLLLATYKGGSHFTSDIKIRKVRHP